MRHHVPIDTPDQASSAPPRTVAVEYAVPQPADALSVPIVQALFADDIPALRTALAAFTAAGYDPSHLRVQGSLDDGGASASGEPRSLVDLVLRAKKVHRRSLQALVQGGCDPFLPHNHAASAITSDTGKNSYHRWLWSFLLAHTPKERWTHATVKLGKLGQQQKVSLVHVAVWSNKPEVLAKLAEHLGEALLSVQGPPLLAWIVQCHPDSRFPQQREMLNVVQPVLAALEQNLLRKTIDANEGAPLEPKVGRARL